jgi:prevent-host-death family protein
MPAMTLTATEAKNRLGQVLEQAQRGPVVIESSGRRHSVVLSAAAYDALVAAAQSNAAGTRPRKGARAIDPGHAPLREVHGLGRRAERPLREKRPVERSVPTLVGGAHGAMGCASQSGLACRGRYAPPG